MQHADAGLLLQAINELVEYYKQSEAKLARRLLWLSTFLRRAETVPLQDKQRVEERLNMFDFLLEQNEFVQKQKALGEIVASQRILIDVVRRRFPNLAERLKDEIPLPFRILDAIPAVETPA